MKKHNFLLINRSDLTESKKFGKPKDVSIFLWGKRLSNWLVIKDFEKIVDLPGCELREIEKACEEA
jgi:hypothetical protein